MIVCCLAVVSVIAPYGLHNVAFVQFNQLAASQNQHEGCQQIEREVIFVPATEFLGGGAIKQQPENAAGQTPQSYVKLYSDHTISTTQTLEPGSYFIQIYSKHARPGPVVLQVMANQQPLGLLIYARDDDSWEAKCLLVTSEYWQSPSDIGLSIRFANDGGENGARDASIAWVKMFTLRTPSSITHSEP